MASIDALVKQAQADGYLRISSSRGLTAYYDAEEPYRAWCEDQGRPLVIVRDLRTRFAEVSVELLPGGVPGNESVDRKYRRRIVALFNQWTVGRLTAREKKEKLLDLLRYGWIRPTDAVDFRIPKRHAARVARSLLKIGMDWTEELARKSSLDAKAKIEDPAGHLRLRKAQAKGEVADAARA